MLNPINRPPFAPATLCLSALIILTACASETLETEDASLPPSATPTRSSSPAASTTPPAAETPDVPAQEATPDAAVAVVTRLPIQLTPDLSAAHKLAALQLRLEQVASGFDKPLGVTFVPDASGRLFVVEQGGTIRIVNGAQTNTLPFIDLTPRLTSAGFEQGLLGFAFHPDYASNGYFFAYYTDLLGDTRLSRFQVSAADPDRGDPDSERILLEMNQPARNHNGGQIAFGPNGYLYVGLGDGGGAGDRFGNAQNTGTFLGKLLRLDVAPESISLFRIPSDNPFVDVPSVLDGIWAYGLRNPWRFSFDRVTGDLYIADVGQNTFEEVNFQAAGINGGQNYGWPIMEARHCFEESSCSQIGLALPVAEYRRAVGCSITGGYVYRGRTLPAMEGIYFFGDFCSGRIWGMARDAEGQWQVRELLNSGISISSFGEDEAGELYVLDHDGGVLYALVPR